MPIINDGQDSLILMGNVMGNKGYFKWPKGKGITGQM